MLEWKISDHPALIQLIKQCLHNVPDQRPSTDELLATLQRMKVEVEGEYGGSPIKLNMMRVRLAKEVKLREQKIREQQVSNMPQSSVKGTVIAPIESMGVFLMVLHELSLTHAV